MRGLYRKAAGRIGFSAITTGPRHRGARGTCTSARRRGHAALDLAWHTNACITATNSASGTSRSHRTVSGSLGEREPGLGVGRDPSRTPMQWDASALRGFRRMSPGCRSRQIMRRAMSCHGKDKTSILCLIRSLLPLPARPCAALPRWMASPLTGRRYPCL